MHLKLSCIENLQFSLVAPSAHFNEQAFLPASQPGLIKYLSVCDVRIGMPFIWQSAECVRALWIFMCGLQIPQRLHNKLCADADYLFDYPNCNWGSLWIFALEHQAAPRSIYWRVTANHPRFCHFCFCVCVWPNWLTIFECAYAASRILRWRRLRVDFLPVKESGELCLLKKCSLSRGVDGQVADIKIDV